ncbi:MAG: DUF2784 domain-containing protein [Candidatus Hydrogenedens sp.]
MFWIKIVDIFLTILHVGLILFFISGWIFKKTRKIHYILVIIIAISWFLLGLLYGFGYCFLTDIHWQIKTVLGEENLPISFIKYILDKITGKDFNDVLVDYVTLTIFVCVLINSTYLYIKEKNERN